MIILEKKKKKESSIWTEAGEDSKWEGTLCEKFNDSDNG